MVDGSGFGRLQHPQRVFGMGQMPYTRAMPEGTKGFERSDGMRRLKELQAEGSQGSEGARTAVMTGNRMMAHPNAPDQGAGLRAQGSERGFEFGFLGGWN